MTAGAYRQIAQVTDFRRFWVGFTLSVTGDALSRVALTWLVYDLTGSAAALGWLLVCFSGPIVVGGLLAGWLLDRFDRRLVMLIDNLARGAAMALIPLLGALGVLALWHLYAVAAVYGLLMMISLAGGPSLVPRLVPPELLATANALEMLSFTLGGVVGPLAAGLLIPLIGAPNVLIFDALSYAVFALLLARIHGAAGPEQASGGTPNARLGQAVQLLVRQPVLLATTVMFLTFNIGGGLLAVALPLLVDQRLAGGPRLYGALLGVLAGGEVLGALVAGQLRLARSYGLSICVAQLLAGMALALTLLPGAAWMVALGLALYGALSAPLTIWAQTLRMRVIPDQLRGRTFALLRTLMQSGNPLGGALGALLLPLAGVSAALAVAALLVGAPGLLGLQVTPLRTDRLDLPPDGLGASEPAPAGGEAG